MGNPVNKCPKNTIKDNKWTMEEKKWVKVFMKDSKYKDSAPWGTGTLSDGTVVRFVFPKDMELPKGKVFEVADVIGGKQEKMSKDGKYNNITYWVDKCSIRKAQGVELPL